MKTQDFSQAHPNPRAGPLRRGRLRWNWRRALRWFAAEFLVVVTGVLVALALNSWWQGRQDAARERAYLLQLSADLETNEELAQRTLDQMNERIRQGAKLHDALRTPTLPPPDSLERWLRESLGPSPLYPRMGSVQALIETGDLNLIRDDALRTGITDYVGAVQTGSEMVDVINDFALRALGALLERVDYRALQEGGTAHTRADWSRLAEDPVFRGSLTSIQLAQQVRHRAARDILQATISLREQVVAELQ